MDRVSVRLDEPPVVVNLGVGVHGVAHPRDVFRLPDLWQFHLYGYSADLDVGGHRHEIRPGRVSLIPPGERITYHYRGRSEHLYAHLRLTEAGAVRTMPLMQDAGAETPALTTLLRQAIEASATAPAMAVAAVWTALWHVARLSDATGPHAAVSAAVAHIESNLAGPLSVAEVAVAAGVSHNHLTRLFRAEAGTTVVAYIRERRLHRARHLLRESTMPIAAVAAAVGIPDLQAFNKVCRRVWGASPRAVRSGS